MPEILTESFCERCGTRYTFESHAPSRSMLGGVRVVSRGLRTFIMDGESSFSEAMAEARSAATLNATVQQLDAFHQTFHFCLSCRQYTCSDCWNTEDGHCLSCAPLPEATAPETAPGSWPILDVGGAAPAAATAALASPAPAAPSAPAVPPVIREPTAAVSPAAPPAAAPVSPSPAPAAPEILPAEPVAPALPPAAAASASAQVEQPEQRQSIAGLPPGQTLEEAIASYEASLAAVQAEPGSATLEAPHVVEPVMATPPAVELMPAAELMPAVELTPAAEIIAAAEIEPATLAELPAPATGTVPAAEVEPATLAELMPATAPEAPEAQLTAAAAAAAPVAEAAPAVPPQAVPAPADEPVPWLTVAPEDTGATRRPIGRPWASSRRNGPTPVPDAVVPAVDAAAMWAASAREVLGSGPVRVVTPAVPAAPAPSARPCARCSLALSANARFCRRCGLRQD